MLEIIGKDIGCMPCKMTKRYLKEHDVEHTYTNIEDVNPDTLEFYKALGHMNLPIVTDTVTKEIFTGFRPNLLDKYIKK